MYTFKEKSRHLRDLHAPNHAGIDLELLKKLDPRNDQLPTLEHAPERKSKHILYALLDVTTAEEIRNNRRTAELKKLKKKDDTDDKTSKGTGEGHKAETGEDTRTEASEDSEIEKEELQDQVAELEKTVDDLETRNAELESELEAEKKSDPDSTTVKASKATTTTTTAKKPASSKKKTSTRTSTGKTSKATTSK